jgi:hypothetical protein
MTDTTNNQVFLTDSETGETMLNTEVTARLEAMFENAVVSEAAKQTLGLMECQEEISEQVDAVTEAVVDIQGNIDEHFQAATETLTDGIDGYISEYVTEEINQLRSQNAALIEGLDRLARSVYSGGDYREWLNAVSRASEEEAANGPGAKPGSAYGQGVPSDAVTRNRKSVAGSNGSEPVNSRGDQGGVFKEEVLVERSDGKIVSLKKHRQDSQIARYIAWEDRHGGSGRSAGATLPEIVDAATVPADQAARLLAEQAPDGTFRDGVEERIQEPAEKAVAIRNVRGDKVALTNLVHAGASRGSVYAALEDLKKPSWSDSHTAAAVDPGTFKI